MKRIIALALLLATTAAQAWDFLYRDAVGNNFATRSADPFAMLDRVHRAETLPVQWAREGDGFRFYVEYDGEEWTCLDGTMTIPDSELPKTISKLDLLLVLHELDKVDTFFAWLDASGLRVYWDAAQALSTDHPLYEQALASVQEALGLSDAECDAILEQIAK